MDTLILHGRRVPAEDYERLKRLATIFVGDLPTDDRQAWKDAVDYAQHVLYEWKERIKER